MERVEDAFAVMALVGAYPGAGDLDQHWENLVAGRFPGTRLEPPATPLSAYRIPAAHGPSIPRIHLLLLALVDRLLAEAGEEAWAAVRERIDVICGTCLGPSRAFLNALRIDAPSLFEQAGRRLPDRARSGLTQARADLDRAVGGGCHDKLYELAATIPAQIALRHRLQGRTFCLDAADLTGLVALEAAMDGLRTGTCDAAIVVVGQVVDHPTIARLFAEKIATPGPLTEAAGAVLLRRLSDVDGSVGRVRAVLRAVSLAQRSAPGPLEYRRGVDVLASADLPGADTQHVECTGVAPPEALAEHFPRGGITVGSFQPGEGYPFAAAGLAALTKLVLSIERKVRLPLGRGPGQVVPWPRGPGGAPRRAGLLMASLGGGRGYLLVEEAQETRARRPPARRPSFTPVAIVGYAGRFPGAPSAERYWRNIVDVHSCLEPLPAGILDRSHGFDPTRADPLKSYTETGAPVELPGFDFLDPRPGHAGVPDLDPAQRLALVVADEALRGSEVARRGARVLLAVATSFTLRSFREIGARACLDELLRDRAEPWVAALAEEGRRRYPAIDGGSLDRCLAAGIPLLISSTLGLDAAAVAIQAACASSLAALDLACRSLDSGARDLALVGGVELGVNHYELTLCSRMHLLSPAACRPFDATADGFALGEGAAFFLLERLADAERAGHRIHGVIRAVGASNDAHSLIAPSAAGQALAIDRAFQSADALGPDDVDYVETHGTGTAVGDVVEASALRRCYGTARRRRPLVLGSAKSMIGHTMAAAGAAGLLRALLGMKAGLYPPHANLARVNPRLELEAIPARILDRPEPWPSDDRGLRRAAVSSFGTGGINYHVLLESH